MVEIHTAGILYEIQERPHIRDSIDLFGEVFQLLCPCGGVNRLFDNPCSVSVVGIVSVRDLGVTGFQ